ncbi:MAG: InlB B-repeat-containing protein, partial [Anaeroplasmataceae bacterium]|nr:InlB B-repeat-containing protein [Anaeroplasmataceae bacterium]
ADHGYRFIGWSDGCKNELHDPITNVQEDMTLIAYFERLSYTAEYRAMEGGRIEGLLIQTELTGNNYERVYAIADEGYKFVGWSDGVTYSNRIDEAGVIYYNNISGQYEGREDFIVYAIFEKIEENSEN